MKIKIDLLAEKSEVVLKVGFNAWIQALIYSNISEELSKRLYNDGFLFENSNFKLFAFSSILEKGIFDNEKKIFTYGQQISFYVSSPIDYFLEEISKTMINSGNLLLGYNKFFISSVNIVKSIFMIENNLKINALTPIEMHSKTIQEDGKNFNYYYNPFEEEFSIFIRNNLLRKWSIFYKEDIDSSFLIKPLFQNKSNEKIMYFGTGEKRTLVKGWKGYFNIESDNSKLLQFALDVGLGGRNHQGFGMIDCILNFK
jgi:CRISPR-associated endoribonuclease Cas6